MKQEFQILRQKWKMHELFVIDGDAEKVSTMTRDFQTNKNMDTVKLVAL